MVAQVEVEHPVDIAMPRLWEKSSGPVIGICLIERGATDYTATARKGRRTRLALDKPIPCAKIDLKPVGEAMRS